MTNLEKIKRATIAELSHEFLYFVPDQEEYHYVGLRGKSFKTAYEVIADNVIWLHEDYTDIDDYENDYKRCLV